jgi:hypothetical protein
MKLSTAKTLTEIDAVVKFAENQLKNVSNAAVIEYRNFVLVENLVILKNIIPQFELVADNKADAVYNEIRGEIKGKYIPENQIEYLLNALTGWLQKLINQKIASREDAIISFEEFDKQFQVLFTRIRTKQELIDYANSKVPAKTELSQKVKERPLYVRQLEIIKSGQDEILEAVTDFFRADSNRLDWIEKGIIDEKAMTDFENHLCSFHANYQKKLMLTESSRPEEDRGRLLLIECQQRQEKIANMNPPDRTVQGSYHVLADEPRLGWHPRWQDMLTD